MFVQNRLDRKIVIFFIQTLFVNNKQNKNAWFHFFLPETSSYKMQTKVWF